MTLAPVWRLGALELTDSPYMVAFGTDYGAPENVTDILRSLLTDGDLEVTSRRGNRTLSLTVVIEGGDLAALAEAEAALWAEVDKVRNELYCDPGDGFAAPFVFDVFRGSMVLNRDDEWERAGYRSWTLNFRALPWPHSATETVTPALPASGVAINSVDTMGSTSGWTATIDGAAATPATAGGALSVTSTALSGTVVETLTRTAAITTSSTKYLPVDWKLGAGNVLVDFTATADGVALAKVASAPSPTAGYTRTWFYVGAASVAAVTFRATTSIRDSNGNEAISPVVRSLTLDNLDRTDIRPSIGSARQQMRSLSVGGSAPTLGSIAVEHATSALGDVLLYTCPDDGSGYVPACRGYRVSGNGPTADATAVSGYYDAISTSTSTFDVLDSALPEGEYLAMVRLNPSGGADGVTTLTWTHVPRMNATSLATATSATTTLSAAVAPRGSYNFHRLGMVDWLWDASPGPTSVNRFTVAATHAGGAEVRLDELYLFNMTTGRLNQFSVGVAAPSAGGASNRVWVDSPSLSNNGLGRYLRGYAADRSDAFSAYASMQDPHEHEFEPPVVKVFSVATNPTTAVDVSLRHKEAAHTHVAA